MNTTLAEAFFSETVCYDMTIMPFGTLTPHQRFHDDVHNVLSNQLYVKLGPNMV